ncbi:MAG: hypothetical protein R2764_25745 [Bacteroidales bacterium]
MKKILTALLLFAFIAVMGQEKMVVRITNPTADDLSKFLKENYDIASFKPREYIDLVVTEELHQQLESAGYSMSVIQTEKELKENLKSGTDLTGYRSYSDLLSELQAIEPANPGICKLYDIGDSRGKRIYSSGIR